MKGCDIFAWPVLVCVCLVCVSGVVQAAEGPTQRAALVAVDYSVEPAQPLVTPHLGAVSASVSRLWSGEVLLDERLGGAVGEAWLGASDPALLANIEVQVARGREIFDQVDTVESIPVFEALLGDMKRLGAVASGSPKHAAMLFEAHMMLWRALERESGPEHLEAMIAETVRRFPAAVVTSQQWPPTLTEAFSVAREALIREGASITVSLRGAADEQCAVTINGQRHGDGHLGGVAVARGVPYYVGARCGDRFLPPRRVVADGHVAVTIDMLLHEQMQVTSAGTTLRIAGGAEAVVEIVRAAVSFGEALDLAEIILAGVFDDAQGQRALQLDRIDVGQGRRVCSVRLVVEGMDARSLDEAVHTLHLRKPPAATPVAFATQDNVYRSVGEYVAWAGEDGSYPVTWSASALALGALTTGAVFVWLGENEQDALAACAVNEDCRASPKINQLRDDVGRLETVRNVTFLTGGVLATAALVAYFLERPDSKDILAPSLPPRAGQWRLEPWGGAGRVGAGVTLPF